jgi:hypothetical protein
MKVTGKIFINYRRDDSAPYAVSIAQYLENAFGKDNVFLDVDRLRPGQHFPDVLNERLRDCKVMVVLIGPTWLDGRDEATGSRRIDNPSDWVRLEIAAALAQGVHVIPILVGGGQFPPAHSLPGELRPLADRHHLVLTTNSFRYEMAGLAKDIAPLVAQQKVPARSRWSIMGVAFRLSIIVGIVATAWSLYKMQSEWVAAVQKWTLISMALECAQGHTDEELVQHANPFGLIDISKVNCADKTFLASLKEIRNPKGAVPKLDRWEYTYPDIALTHGISAMVATIGLGLFLVFARWLALWVMGMKRPAS